MRLPGTEGDDTFLPSQMNNYEAEKQTIIPGKLLNVDDKLRRWGMSVFTIAMFIIFWQVAAVKQWLSLPTPGVVTATLIRLIVSGDPVYGKTLQQMTFASLMIVLKGCFLSMVTAIPLGMMLGTFRFFEQFAGILLEMFRPIPPLAWIPLAYILFQDFSSPTTYVQIFVVFVGAFFPVLLNTTQGIKSVEKRFINAAITCGATRWQIISKVLFPASISHMVTGLRIGLGVGWMCVIAAEFVGGKMGIGYYIWSVYSIGGRSAEIIAGTITIGLIGYLMNKLFLVMEKRLQPWR